MLPPAGAPVHLRRDRERNGASGLLCPARPLQGYYLTATPPRRASRLLAACHRYCSDGCSQAVCPAGCLPAFSPGAGQCPRGSAPAKPTDLSNSRLEAPLAARTHRTQPLYFPPVNGLGMCSPVGSLGCSSLFLSRCRSPGSLSSTAVLVAFCPKLCLRPSQSLG